MKSTPPTFSNNNNVDINYNTINQDSNSIVSNSENTNMVMAVILPVPGRRSITNINRWNQFNFSEMFQFLVLDL